MIMEVCIQHRLQNISERQSLLVNICMFLRELISPRVVCLCFVTMTMTLGVVSAMRYLGITLVNYIVNLILKKIFNRQRPYITHDCIEHLSTKTEKDTSFPSAHAQGSMSILFMTTHLWHMSDNVYMIVFVLVFLISISRVYLGVHYPSDIVGGWIVGYLLSTIIF